MTYGGLRRGTLRRQFNILAMLVGLLAAAERRGSAQSDPRYFDLGTPTTQEIWVDPTAGNDSNTGNTRAQALRTVTAAWGRIPIGSTLTTTGYRIKLVAGTYPSSDVPVYWESRYGTFDFPIILEAADAPRSAHLPSLNIFDCRYLYLIGLDIAAGGGDVLHFDTCDHVLLRNTRVRGAAPATFAVQETLKINQTQYIYVEDSDISGAWDNAFDCVACQYGHVQGNLIHDSGDWCEYLKGGSAYFRVEGNQYYDCGTGGFTAGQGTGFEFMASPWLHYEAYDIKFLNNIIHDADGAAFGVNGGYNILFAHNTAYRIGSRDHIFEAVFGERECDGNTSQCSSYLAAGGWGGSNGTVNPIPNRNVFVYNNLFYNPTGVQSLYQHFAIYGPRTPAGGSNIPNPAHSDTNLQIRGNLLWNGPSGHPLGIEDTAQGCQPSNSTCNASQLVADNTINSIEPQLVSPASGDFHPVASGNVYGATTYTIPSFSGGDRPTPPTSPAGDLSNTVTRDFSGAPRGVSSPPGAYGGDCSMAVCGDGTRVLGCEQCDDGNPVDGDGCDTNCTNSACGNGIIAGSDVCDDGNLTSGDGCDANCRPTGCGNGIVTTGEQCDDGNLVEGDGCTATCGLSCPNLPRSDCRAPTRPAKSQLSITDASPDSGDKLSWKWTSGAATTKEEFGSPLTSTLYQLCVYDRLSSTPNLTLTATIGAGGTCGGRSCWKESARGFGYAGRASNTDGIESLKLGSGSDGRAKISLKGKGAGLPMPALPFQQDPSVTVQLQNSAGLCWHAVFSAPSTTSSLRFKDSSD